jgi:hypothetical protein
MRPIEEPSLNLCQLRPNSKVNGTQLGFDPAVSQTHIGVGQNVGFQGKVR